MKKLFLIAAVAMLSGCATTPSDVTMDTYPDNYREQVRDQVKRSFFDPYSLQDVKISMPMPGTIMFQSGWVSCFQANAKNRMGGYTGLKKTAFLFSNGRLVNKLQNAAMCNNPQLAYSDWPNMESAEPKFGDKEKWVGVLARKNGCESIKSVNLIDSQGVRESYQVDCGSKKIDFTCEFTGPVSVDSYSGIPSVEVKGKSYKTQPACWL